MEPNAKLPAASLLRRPGAGWLLTLASSFAVASTAHGGEDEGDSRPPFDLESLVRPGVYLPVGVSVAGAFRDPAPDGLMLGAEASLVSLGQIGPPGTWLGGYLDGAWDFGAEAFRHSTGPQFGIAMLGLDVGYLGELRAGTYRPGLAGRGFITLGILAVYGRYGRLYGREAAGDDDVAEFGVLAKVPLLLWEQREPASDRATTASFLRGVPSPSRHGAWWRMLP